MSFLTTPIDPGLIQPMAGSLSSCSSLARAANCRLKEVRKIRNLAAKSWCSPARERIHAAGARARISWGGSAETGCLISLTIDEWDFVIRESCPYLKTGRDSSGRYASWFTSYDTYASGNDRCIHVCQEEQRGNRHALRSPDRPRYIETMMPKQGATGSVVRLQ